MFINNVQSNIGYRLIVNNNAIRCHACSNIASVYRYAEINSCVSGYMWNYAHKQWPWRSAYYRGWPRRNKLPGINWCVINCQLIALMRHRKPIRRFTHFYNRAPQTKAPSLFRPRAFESRTGHASKSPSVRMRNNVLQTIFIIQRVVYINRSSFFFYFWPTRFAMLKKRRLIFVPTSGWPLITFDYISDADELH